MAESKRARQRQFGNIRELPSGRYQARYRGPDGRLRSADVTFETKADANAWLSVTQTSIITGDWRAPELSRETFEAYGTRWLASRTDLRPRTAELYESLWDRWVKPHLGSTPLGKLTTEGIRSWVLAQTTAHPGSTQPAKAYRLVRAMLNTAIDDGLLRVNPCRVKGAGKERSPERPVAMPDEVARIANSIESDYRPMVLLAAYCSLRFGELAGLRRHRVDLLHKVIRVEECAVELKNGSVIFGPPKTDAGVRTVAVPDDLVAMLEDHLAEHVDRARAALVFTSPEGHALRRTKFRSRWLAACEKAGIEGLHFHDLRGSGATWAATTGATVAELMSRLGHSTAAVAMRYQHATAERDRAIADRLGELMRAAESAGDERAAVVPIHPR